MDEKDIPYQLDRYLKGRLTEEEKDRLWEEFLKHPEYLEWLEIEVNARDYLKNGPGSDRADRNNVTRLSEPVEPARRHNYLVYAAAVLLLALTGLIGYLFMADSPDSGLAITDIPYSEMHSTVILRGPETETSEEDMWLSSGVEAAMSGRLDESIDHFNAVMEGAPTAEQASMARFNLALLFYNQGDFSQSESTFLAAAADAPSGFMREAALWYRANALLRLGERGAAIAQLEDVSQLEGAYREEALALLNRLRGG